MKRATPSRYALILCLGAASLSAQEPQMIPPPPPAPYTVPPPDPNTLPPPPQFEWAPLGPKDEGGEAGTADSISVPPTKDDIPIAPPPPGVEIPVVDGFDPAQMELVKAEVEVWREDSEWPQIPPRHFNQLETAYITGIEPVWLRVQFSPQAAGKSVSAKAGRGLTLATANPVLTISSTGQCLVMAQLHESVFQSHIIFYCEGVKTILPISRASLETVQGAEAETGGGQ
jgi:hypothetical protein